MEKVTATRCLVVRTGAGGGSAAPNPGPSPNSSRAAHPRKVHPERTPLADGGLHTNEPAGIADDLVDDRQAHAGPLTPRLGGEEWVEDSGQCRRLDSCATVAHCDQDTLTWLAGFVTFN